MIKKYQFKRTVEAVQFLHTQESIKSIDELTGTINDIDLTGGHPKIYIHTPENKNDVVNIGDYIVKEYESQYRVFSNEKFNNFFTELK